MGIFYKENRVIHFVHIPKTGGESVNLILKQNGWKIHPKSYHVSGAAGCHQVFEQYSKINLTFEHEFTLVRNPVERCVSSIYYLYRKHPEQPMHPNEITPYHMIKYLHNIYTKAIPNLGNNFDGNFWAPQTEFIGNNTKVFKLEDLNIFLQYLKKNRIVSERSFFPHENKSIETNVGYPDWSASEDTTKYFFEFYRRDFENLNYPVPKWFRN